MVSLTVKPSPLDAILTQRTVFVLNELFNEEIPSLSSALDLRYVMFSSFSTLCARCVAMKKISDLFMLVCKQILLENTKLPREIWRICIYIEFRDAMLLNFQDIG